MSFKRKLSLKTWLLLLYLALLATSHAVRVAADGRPVLQPGETGLLVQAVDGDTRSDSAVRLVYRDLQPESEESAPTVLLLHGSPGRGAHLDDVARILAERFRVIVPDLPGFGASTRRIPDYSMRAHAQYVEQLLEKLEIGEVHIVAFSMGGGVALNLYDLSPERVRSLTMLAASGVQELELLGDYHLNHLVHGLQLAFLWAVHEGTPHMGLLDDSMLSVAYARNFYDSDQRPLRGILTRFEPPMFIFHGDRDPLVPPEAAREHHRIVPHSELLMLRASHFLPFTRSEETAGQIAGFVQRAASGRAPERSDATPSRRAAAGEPFDPRGVPAAAGLALLVVTGLIAAATLVSEDLTCIGVGLMVAAGRIGFVPGVVACFLGIYVGDLLLYLAGRVVGRAVVSRPPLRWLVGRDRLERSSRWFARRGPIVIVLSRFMPGARLPTYVAAGVLRTSFLSFSLWFLLAAGVWTPILVGLAAVVGLPSLAFAQSFGTRWRLIGLAVAVGLLIAIRLGIRGATYRGRRQLVSWWRRLTRWEFWPPWIFYVPVVPFILYLGARHRGPTLFTAANPTLPAGGFVGESKSEILQGLAASGAPVARFRLIPGPASVEERIDRARGFMRDEGLAYPIVLKPDAGQRGSGVEIVKSDSQLEHYLAAADVDTLVQEYVPGIEFGVFYYRYPDEEGGRIFSITEKRMPVVEGDGRRTLERLILDDPRAVAMSRVYLQAHDERRQEIPAAGEKVRLVEIGTHCRGAVFLDGERILTPALERAVDRISVAYPGFHFGRYDFRGPSVESFREGRDLKIVELNGVTSESTDIYDPRNRLGDAYRKLFRQWRLAFEIGARNRERGVKPTPPLSLAALILKHLKR